MNKRFWAAYLTLETPVALHALTVILLVAGEKRAAASLTAHLTLSRIRIAYGD